MMHDAWIIANIRILELNVGKAMTHHQLQETHLRLERSYL